MSSLRPAFASSIFTFLLITGCRQAQSATTPTAASAGASSVSVQTSTVADAGVSQPPATTASVAASSSAVAPADTRVMDDLTPLGLPIYPNVFERGWTDARALGLPLPVAQNGVRNAQMTTHDSFATVYAWYHERMPAGSETSGDASSSHTNGDGDFGAQFEIGSAGQPGYKRVLLLSSKGNTDTTVSLFGPVTH